MHPIARLPEEWLEALAALGEPRYRALQLFRWIHARGVMDPERMTDLPKPLRAALAADGLGSPWAVAETHGSADGARKLVLRAKDGVRIETVLLPASAPAALEDADGAAADDDAEGERLSPAEHVRVTQCVSTQVGCAMGCVLCASGAVGLVRQLKAEEIVAEVLLGHTSLEPNEALRNIVFMGMGEPLHNYEATARAIRLLTHPEGLGLAPRRITVSTCGLIPEIARLSQDFGGQIGLAVSLHGGRDETRRLLTPIAKRYPLAELVVALERYRLPIRRKITIEYTLVAGHNDSVAEARALGRALRELRVKINLIPLNAIEGSSLKPPRPEAVSEFQRVLVEAGYLCFVRRRRGDDVSAACGQLALGGARGGVRRITLPDEAALGAKPARDAPVRAPKPQGAARQSPPERAPRRAPLPRGAEGHKPRAAAGHKPRTGDDHKPRSAAGHKPRTGDAPKPRATGKRPARAEHAPPAGRRRERRRP